jgi:hypothetical protein
MFAGRTAMFTCLDIDASALIADPDRALLYAVVTGGAIERANELVVIDPVHGTVTASVVVGSDPDSLALSDDGTTLWVGLHGAAAIRKVDLTRFPPEPGEKYTLPRSTHGPSSAVYAGFTLALPGTPDSVLLALQYEDLSPTSAGVVLVDSGIARENRIDEHPGVTSLTTGPPGYLFGTDHVSDLLTIRVDADGLTATPHDAVVQGALSSVVYDEGFLYTTGGQVIDVTVPDAPVLAGKFPNTGRVIPHTARSYAVMLSAIHDPMPAPAPDYAFNSIVLRRANLATFSEDFALALDGYFFNPDDFVEPSPGVFAFRDYEIPPYEGAPFHRTGIVLVSAPELAE